jgi:hypothetical protein
VQLRNIVEANWGGRSVNTASSNFVLAPSLRRLDCVILNDWFEVMWVETLFRAFWEGYDPNGRGLIPYCEKTILFSLLSRQPLGHIFMMWRLINQVQWFFLRRGNSQKIRPQLGLAVTEIWSIRRVEVFRLTMHCLVWNCHVLWTCSQACNIAPAYSIWSETGY